jgi:hypothetical protein
METLTQHTFFDNPVWIVPEDIDVHTVVVDNGDTTPLGKTELELMLEGRDPWFFERIVEIKDGSILGQVKESIATNDFHIPVSPQSPLYFTGDHFIHLNTDDLVDESAAQPPINNSSLPAANINQDIGLSNGVFGKDQRKGGVVRASGVFDAEMSVWCLASSAKEPSISEVKPEVTHQPFATGKKRGEFTHEN